ncbi:copper resistance protein CopC [Nocardioides psychrotolerans]|uniref:copper resistance CopC/CopD family protein n=1 Tax=Nocardioides psychrotolerans TaxID=1005945 RepID=UPI00313816F8
MIDITDVRTRRRLCGAVAAVLAVLALLLVGAAPASAHATLVSSDPAEGEVVATVPDVVTFTFDEPVNLTADAVRVFDAAGDPVDSSAEARDTVVTADLPDELDDGTYVVTWRAVSSDGHPISGSLTFSIGAPSETVVAPPVDAAPSNDLRSDLSVVQAIQYVGLLLAAGLVVFGTWIGGAVIPAKARVRIRLVAGAAAGAAVLGAAGAVPLAGAYQQGLGLEGAVSAAAFDLSLVGDDLLVLVLVVVGLGLAVLGIGEVSRVGRPRLLATTGAAVAVLAPALVGHTRAFEPVTLLVVTDVVHLAAGATWLGGLVGLAITLPLLAHREREAALVVSRFSSAAAAVLVLLVATGSLMAWRVLGSWAGLVDTTYGTLLLVKVGIALVVVALAAHNRFRLLPRARSAVGHRERTATYSVVRRTVLAEAGLLAVLLAVTGFLVNQSPRGDAAAAAAAAPSRVTTGSLEDFTVLATLSPGSRGPNTLSLQLQDLAGEPLDGFAAPEVSVRSAQADVDLGLVPVVPTAAGTYAAEVVFPTSGTWEVQVSLRESEFANPVTTLSVEVR